MGYCGGTTPHPTYHDLGDHSETIQVDYDPSVISYEQLLNIALYEGNFSGPGDWSRQYRSVVFYHDAEQLAVARKMGIKKLEPFRQFTRAEDYHQKYYLRQSSVAGDFYQIYPDARSFTDATATARANGILGGYVEKERLPDLVDQLGVSEGASQELRSMAGHSPAGCAVPKPR